MLVFKWRKLAKYTHVVGVLLLASKEIPGIFLYIKKMKINMHMS